MKKKIILSIIILFDICLFFCLIVKYREKTENKKFSLETPTEKITENNNAKTEYITEKDTQSDTEDSKDDYIYSTPQDFLISGIVEDYFFTVEDVYVRKTGENKYELISAKDGKTREVNNVTIEKIKKGK